MKINVSRIAELANLSLSKKEIDKFEKQLNETLDYINILNEIDTTNTKETSQITGLENVTRNDITAPSLSQQEALSNTKFKHSGMFKVKTILKQ